MPAFQPAAMPDCRWADLAAVFERGEARLEFVEFGARPREYLGLRVELLASDEFESRELLRQQRLEVLLQVRGRRRLHQRGEALLQIVQERSLVHESVIGGVAGEVLSTAESSLAARSGALLRARAVAHRNSALSTRIRRGMHRFEAVWALQQLARMLR